MNRFCVVLFVAVISSAFAGGLPSSSYGVPHEQLSSGYSTSHETGISSSVGLDLEEQHIGHQTSEGFHLDENLLHKIKEILIENENHASSISSPSSSYGPPKHWSPSSNVVDIHFGHLTQSIPVAQYVEKQRYASNYNEGWNAASSGWTSGVSSDYAVLNAGLNVPSHSQSELQEQSEGWIEPRSTGETAGWNSNSASSEWNVAQLSAPQW